MSKATRSAVKRTRSPSIVDDERQPLKQIRSEGLGLNGAVAETVSEAPVERFKDSDSAGNATEPAVGDTATAPVVTTPADETNVVDSLTNTQANNQDKENAIKTTAAKMPSDSFVQAKIAFQAVEDSADKIVDMNGITADKEWGSKDTKRFVALSKYCSIEDGVYNMTMEPATLLWNSGNIKTSRLRVSDGGVVKYYILGTLTWNGLLPRDGKNPNRAKVSIRPLRERDIMRARQLVEQFSKSKKALETDNMVAISAHCDMNTRARGADESEAKPFTKLYDGRNIFSPDKSDMAVIAPKFLVRGDVVLVEATVGRFWDETVNGKVKDFSSTRVYFNLDAVTLLRNGADEEGDVTVGKGKKVIF